MKLDHRFENKVYAGVLGKIIGVYLGRPFEGWPYDKIMKELGPIYYYVNDKLNVPMHVTDAVSYTHLTLPTIYSV